MILSTSREALLTESFYLTFISAGYTETRESPVRLRKTNGSTIDHRHANRFIQVIQKI